VGENRKLLIFKLEEVPELGRGQGVYLQRYKDGGLIDAATFTWKDGLKDENGRLFEAFGAERLARRAVPGGRIVPRGWAKSASSCELEATDRLFHLGYSRPGCSFAAVMSVFRLVFVIAGFGLGFAAGRASDRLGCARFRFRDPASRSGAAQAPRVREIVQARLNRRLTRRCVSHFDLFLYVSKSAPAAGAAHVCVPQTCGRLEAGL
jgi:hypothetical protein